MRRLAAVPILAAAAAWARPAEALETGKYRYEPRGRVKAVRAADVDGDGRQDVVLLLEPKEGGAPELWVLRSPAQPDPRTFFGPDSASRVVCDGDLGRAGAVAVGRFGEEGEYRLRFFGPDGMRDLDARCRPRRFLGNVRTLLVRSPDRPIVVWDGVADLDGDGRDECWFPVPDGGGAMHVLGGTPGGDRRLDLTVHSAASSSAEDLVKRAAYVPNLAAADLDGDGRKELLALQGGMLVAWPAAGTAAAADGAVPPSFRLPLPFLEAPEDLGPDEHRTPRLQVADVDADGRADLLVTVIRGKRDEIRSLRTSFYWFLGPLADPATGALRPPGGRIDTESAALHPRFVDLDGDGALDYLTDSMRGTLVDLLKRVMGQEPTMWHVAYRFDRAARRYEEQPLFSLERPYSGPQALANKFGISAWLDVDFDGDGLKDLLDLGNLTGVEVLGARRRAAGAVGDPVQFPERLVPRIAVPKGLSAGALPADLNGDGRTDVVLWNDEELFVLAPKGGR